MSLVRARITQARQKAKTIAAAVPGLAAGIIHLGVVTPEGEEDDESLLNLIRSKTPTAWDVSAGNVTITCDSPHSFKVGDIVTISIAALAQNYAVTVTAVTSTTFTFVNPEPGATLPIVFIEGDLCFTLRIVIKAADMKSFKVQEQKGDSVIEILMYFGIEYASQTFIAIEDVAIALRDALAEPTNWAGLNSGPDEIAMAVPKLTRKTIPVPGYYPLTLTFEGG